MKNAVGDGEEMVSGVEWRELAAAVVEGRVTAGVPIKAQQAASGGVRLANCQMTTHGGTGSGRDSPNRLVSTRQLRFGLSGPDDVPSKSSVWDAGLGLPGCSFG
jgi:hypothetical protein